MVKFALASDHAGFSLKETVKKILDSENIPYQDYGTDSDSSVDYPDYAKKAIQAILEGRAEQGILVCGSGVGMSMVANRYPGIRAALVAEPQAAEMTRRHNNANVLVLPGWVFEPKKIEQIIDAWRRTKFEGGRHQRRLDKITAIEQEILAGHSKGE